MLFIELDRENKRSFSKQIYIQIRKKILHGELKCGERFPSTRELSGELHVSRNTVLTAYDMLISEGFAHSIPGSGIYVSEGAVKLPFPQPFITDSYTASLSANKVAQETINFDSGIPALDLFPRNKWKQLVSRSFMEAPASALGYDDPQGRPELRKVLAVYLEKSRGIHCNPEQIIITSGAKQGLTLIAKCLLDQNSEVWLEDPSNANVRQIFSYHTKHIMPIPVDHEGILTDKFPLNGKPALIFVTPSHQFPMGGILSIQRRLELIMFAEENGHYLVEDDYDSEFRYGSIPVHALCELNSERVIYIGTFSKVMFPSLRLGYMVLPYSLLEQCLEWKRLADHHSNSIYQLALMRFIESGELERHIMRMKKVYYKRRCSLLELLEAHFPGQVSIYGKSAGMHIVAGFDGVVFSPELMQRIQDAGVYIVPVENHSLIQGKHLDQVILGYAQLNQDEMAEGLSRLKRILTGTN